MVAYNQNLKQRLNKEIVKDIIQNLGFTFNRQNKFNIRDEKSPSVSISDSLYIKDFGGDFGGDIISLVQYQKNYSFTQALNYIAPFVGMETYSNDKSYQEPKPLPQLTNKEPQQDIEILNKAKATKQQHKRDINDTLLLKGIQDLYPSIDSLDGLEKIRHFFGWSKFHNSLTIEFPKCSIIRRDRHGNKWRAVKGNKRDYIHTKINSSDKYVYLATGMSEIIALELMEVSYIILQSDKIINLDGIIEQINNNNQILVILEENDSSSKKLSEDLIKNFNQSKILNLLKLIGKDDRKNEEKYHGYDVRDFVNELNNFSIVKAFIQSGTNSTPTIEQPTKDKKEIVIPYDGKYISNQNKLDISTIKNGVIVAVTGSGKTYHFENKPNVLILVPRVKQTTVETGEGSNYLIDKIFDSGAVITYEKFAGHYFGSGTFRDLINKKQIKLIVDEAHTLLDIPKNDYQLIYGMDAVFMSGTIEKFFRTDLQRYKFKPKKPMKIYYTNGLIPDFKNALYFIDNAKALKNNYSENCVIGSQHNHNNIDIHSHKKGKVFATSALREGVSINHNNFDACVVVKDKCHLWSTKDIIQGVNRPRNNFKRIVTGEIKKTERRYLTFDFFMNKAQEISETKDINAIAGEFFSKFINLTHKVNGYVKPTEYGVACYLAYISRNYYDEDLYRFEEYKEEFEPLKINTNINLKDEEEAEGEIYINGVKCIYPRKNERKAIKWKYLFESGAVKRFSKYTELTSFNDLYTKSRIGKEIKANYNKLNKNKFTKNDLLKIIKSCVQIELYNLKKEKIKYATKEDFYIKVVGVNPAQIEGEIWSLHFYMNNTEIITSKSQDLGVYRRKSCPVSNGTKKGIKNELKTSQKQMEINKLNDCFQFKKAKYIDKILE